MNQNMTKLDQITLVIPTYNRPQFLARLLNYYASKHSKVHFLILDSSTDENKALNKQVVAVLGDRVRYESYSSSMPVAEKLLAGLKLVTTPYCSFCADDDLVFVEGLSEALSFLQANPSYVCVDGIYLNFNPHGKDMNLVIEYATRGISAEDPGARVFKLYQKYESLFYGVFETKNAINIFSGVSKNPSLHFQELFQATSALFLGKSHRLPIFYAARQHCDPADLTRDKWQTYYWFAENTKEFVEHYIAYREELWLFYENHVSDRRYTKEEFFKVLDIAHAMYFGIGCPPEYFHSTLQSRWPSDPFQKANRLQDNVCNQLKNPRRLSAEVFMDRLAKWLPKKVSSFYSPSAMKKLNRTVREKTNDSWNCKLSPDLRWLAGVDSFCGAYLELCRYMSLPVNSAK